jgi:hypothetical protein
LFLLTPLAAIFSFRFTRAPSSHLFAVLGVLSLAALVGSGIAQLITGNLQVGLGVGGIERLAVYPFLLWMIGFGAYLTGAADEFVAKASQRSG